MPVQRQFTSVRPCRAHQSPHSRTAHHRDTLRQISDYHANSYRAQQGLQVLRHPRTGQGGVGRRLELPYPQLLQRQGPSAEPLQLLDREQAGLLRGGFRRCLWMPGQFKS